ncbi:MAG: hypothetical protein JXB30_17945 [Anaerolineae bacterium]|nr:hypothetical protein [Anaerolineae bacterium]
METAVTIIFFALIISAPWINRKWGNKGGWVWAIISMAFLITVIVFMD